MLQERLGQKLTISFACLIWYKSLNRKNRNARLGTGIFFFCILVRSKSALVLPRNLNVFVFKIIKTHELKLESKGYETRLFLDPLI